MWWVSSKVRNSHQTLIVKKKCTLLSRILQHYSRDGRTSFILIYEYKSYHSLLHIHSLLLAYTYTTYFSPVRTLSTPLLYAHYLLKISVDWPDRTKSCSAVREGGEPILSPLPLLLLLLLLFPFFPLLSAFDPLFAVFSFVSVPILLLGYEEFPSEFRSFR